MKVVMVVNNELPFGLIANTTAVLGITLGYNTKGIIGINCSDADGYSHKGITKISIPILSATEKNIKNIFNTAVLNEKIRLINFNNIAQACRNYNEYTQKLSQTKTRELQYSGLCLQGPRKEIDRLVGSLPLL